MGERLEGGRGLNFRTFSWQVEGKTGHPTIQNTLTIAVVCSKPCPRVINVDLHKP